MSDLLKQAIADAKAVRATALANAKAALEEQFGSKLQSMLSEKLAAEMAEDEAAAPVAPEAHADAAQDAAMAAPAPAAAPAAAPVAQEPALPVEETAMEEGSHEEEEEEMDEVRGTLTVAPDAAVNSELHAGTFVNEGDKASSNYKAKTKGYKTDNKGQEVVDATKLSTPGEGGKSVSSDRKAADKYDGAGTQQKGGPVKDMHNKAPKTDNKGQEVEDATKLSTPALKENSEELDEASLDEILKELEDGLNEVGMEEAAPTEAAAHHEEMDEEINLDELLNEDTEEESEEEEIEEGKLPPGLAKYQKEHGKDKKDDDKDEEKVDEVIQENLSLKKELEEYRSAVTYLRNQINEINLLNAKLLYTNKLFKQSNLNNEQKLKVIESFDLTKSVREAKLVYATLAESLNNSAKKVVEAPKKEVSKTVKTITEGLASKPVASTKPTTAAVLTEGAEMANRFKKLAGIRK